MNAISIFVCKICLELYVVWHFHEKHIIQLAYVIEYKQDANNVDRVDSFITIKACFYWDSESTHKRRDARNAVNL